MCLLIFKPAGKLVPNIFLENAADRNPHGCGIAFAKDNKIVVEKSAKWGATEIAKVLEDNHEYPSIIHFRYATHGSQTKDNTHPFILNESWVAAHNGIIPSVKTKGDESDTRAFLRQRVIPLLNNNVRLDDNAILAQLGKAMGQTNKMAFLSADGSFGIANETSGHWKDGVWYSNHSYEEYTSNIYVPKHYTNQVGFYTGREQYFSGTSRSSMTESKYYSEGTYYNDNYPEEEELENIYTRNKPDNDEVWHLVDLHALSCDSCGQNIKDEFRLEGHSGLMYCFDCYNKI